MNPVTPLNPHTPAAVERSLLGAILCDTAILSSVVAKVAPEDFWSEANRATFTLMIELDGEGIPWDRQALFEEAMARGIDRYGGAVAVLGLEREAPDAAAWESYARIVLRMAFARRLRGLGEELVDRAAEGTDPARVLAAHEAALLTMRRPETGADGWTLAADAADEDVAAYEARERTGGGVSGLSTGWTDLDRLTSGFQPADLVVLGGRPSMGKTAVLCNLLRNIAENGGAVGMFSMEMSRRAIARRLLCSIAQVDSERFRNTQLDWRESERVQDAREHLRGLPIYLDDRVGLTIAEMRLRARRLVAARPNLRLLAVDYVQLAKGTGARGATREQDVAEVSKGLKQIGRETGLPVLAVAQLNRDVEKRDVKDRRPRPGDLRDSGQIEQDADVVIFIYRDEVYDPTTADRGIAELIIAKQREGRLGTVKLAWRPELQTFSDLSRMEPPPRSTRGSWDGAGREFGDED